MTSADIERKAAAWIERRYVPFDSARAKELAEDADFYDYEYNEPEVLWLLILEIHRRDQSIKIRQVLSAGPIEDLLAKHGDAFIDRVEATAKSDPSFAKVLGGVWQNTMSDENWSRLQMIWDRRGWDGIPE